MPAGVPRPSEIMGYTQGMVPPWARVVDHSLREPTEDPQRRIRHPRRCGWSDAGSMHGGIVCRGLVDDVQLLLCGQELCLPFAALTSTDDGMGHLELLGVCACWGGGTLSCSASSETSSELAAGEELGDEEDNRGAM